MKECTETKNDRTESVSWQKGMNGLYLILKDPAVFSRVDYKVQHDCADRCFVRSMEIFFNGARRILYLPGTAVPLGSLLQQFSPGSFASAAGSLLQNILEVRRNGFLRVENIDLSFEHIFTDPVTFQTFLIYIPVSGSYYPDSQFFENLFRTSAAGAMRQNPGLTSKRTEAFADALERGASLEELAACLSCSLPGTTDLSAMPDGAEGQPQNAGCLYLIAVNGERPIVFRIMENEYVIGRSPEKADGLIRGNRMVGRIHCRILRRGAEYFAEDMHSANGTWVNGKKLIRGENRKLSDGDILRVADISFRAVLG